MSVWIAFHDEGIIPGVSREFAKNAGKALSIPATNQPSACTRLIGRRNLRLATDHHARTGIEKPSSQRGTASKMKMTMAPSDIPDEVVATESKMLTNTHPRNRAHGLHDEGNSSGVPSSKRWRSILVGFIVVIEVESARLWRVEPLESGMAFQICITEGLVSLRTKSTRGIANKPPPMISRGFHSRTPIVSINAA
tara:strand:- start:6364 stop:6948 length:585 start_codon:yes stop_codon:yes gene_type:complete